MSMNQYMHPRNIYKQPPNFKELALEYPLFRKHVTQDITGKVTIDFKNLEALRALTITLLKKDFDLVVEIPANKLIPTVPLRLNYILWLEDLLHLFGSDADIKGIDIGTGASCIYPLIGAKKLQWSMVATDIDKTSVECASNNVKVNNLDHLIKVELVSGNSLITEVLKKYPEQYNFCMCNPPFFANPQELNPSFKARRLDRPRPKNAFCASVDEVVAKGGEVEYITRLIDESKDVERSVKIWSTMLGHKNSLPPLKKLLRDSKVTSFKQTEFCQGNTTRWGLAWTYCNVDLTKIPDSVAAKEKKPKPLVYELPIIEEADYKVSVVSSKIVTIFKELQMHCQEIKHVNNLIEHIITAFANTWSHQRRKRRERLRCSIDEQQFEATCEQLAEMKVKIVEPVKRGFDEDEPSTVKRIKSNVEEFCSEKIYLKAKASVIKYEESVVLELEFIEGNGTKEALHQVLQYIKNHWTQKEI